MTDKPPAPMVTLTKKGFMPLTSYDAEQIDALALGSEFDLVARSTRSMKHLRTYWKALHGVVKATDKWATAEYLHDDLMYSCGFVHWGIDLNTGQPRQTRSSISINKMKQAEFKEYFDKAMAKLAEAVGYDPLRFMEAPA